MRSFKTLALCCALIPVCCRADLWELGELSYSDDEVEISAFVNTQDLQLQTVLCTKGQPYNSRFTVILPTSSPLDMVIQVQINADTTTSTVYGELNGNSLELQLDPDLVATLPDSPNLSMSFSPEIASFLGIEKTIDIPMSGADFALRQAALECTALCLGNGYQCDSSQISALLWPRDFFRAQRSLDIDDLCSVPFGNGYGFNLTDECKFALDRFYQNSGIGPLSFLYEIFHNGENAYAQYVENWNQAVEHAPNGKNIKKAQADDSEWYLILYSLIGTRHISDFPNSYYQIRNLVDDPTTLVYDTDTRYDMEALKYSAVLYRQLRGSVTALAYFENALHQWQEFYRNLLLLLPHIKQAQALRPVIYRAMLMRLWRLGNMPAGIRLNKEQAFVQGHEGKTVTNEYLEQLCSFFDGLNQEQFFFASDGCVSGTLASVRENGLRTPKLNEVLDAWDSFAHAWMDSKFYNDSVDDAVGENLRSNLALALLSATKLYGFGDYFLLRQCIGSRDNDICEYELSRAEGSYHQEMDTHLKAISQVSAEDAATLNQLGKLFERYYQNLCDYLDELVSRDRLPSWRANFVKGVAFVVQTSALLSISYDREVLEDDFAIDEAQD